MHTARPLVLKTLRIASTTLLALLSAGLPLFFLTAMICMAFEFEPDTAGVIFIAGMTAIGTAAIFITIVVHRLDGPQKRRTLTTLALISLVGIVTTIIAWPNSSAQFPRYLPLVSLLRLDTFDVTAAEDATVYEPWFEVWLILITFTLGGKWLSFLFGSRSSTLTPRR